jgi:tRNA 2-thiouridine synthesizing protein A
MSAITVTSTLDTSGKCCPMPIVETNRAMKGLGLGDILEIIATDTGTQKDIPSWCERTGQTLLSMTEENGVLHYHVRKDR